MPSTFEAISKADSLCAVADEWRESEGPSDRAADSGTDSEEAFQSKLHLILLLARKVQREKSHKNNSAFPQFMEAIRDVASVESNLDRLLAVRDKRAVEVIEALQTVRSLASQAPS
jgi:phage terminase small subunit